MAEAIPVARRDTTRRSNSQSERALLVGMAEAIPVARRDTTRRSNSQSERALQVLQVIPLFRKID
jgi:hypothetical protein